MRVHSSASQQPFANHLASHPLPSLPTGALLGVKNPVSQRVSKSPLWWGPLQNQNLHYDLSAITVDPASTSLEALKTTRLTLNLWRQGRQIAAELSLTLVTPFDEATYPVTLFTGS